MLFSLSSQAYWLRSSVVSVLFSVTTEIRPSGRLLSNLFLCLLDWLFYEQPLRHRFPQYCTTSGWSRKPLALYFINEIAPKTAALSSHRTWKFHRWSMHSATTLHYCLEKPQTQRKPKSTCSILYQWNRPYWGPIQSSLLPWKCSCKFIQYELFSH